MKHFTGFITIEYENGDKFTKSTSFFSGTSRSGKTSKGKILKDILKEMNKTHKNFIILCYVMEEINKKEV